jgi:outer membrane cobalamin receptor
MVRPPFRLFILITLVCVVAPLVTAAAPASIHGRVLDPSGQPVAGAAITLRAPSGAARTVRAERDGVYAFTDVVPGAYDLLVAADGFRAEPSRVVAGAGDALSMDITLRLAALADSVVVSASYIDMPTSEATSEVFALTRRQMADRQFDTLADALRLVPGASVAPTGGLGSVTSLFPRGGESDYTLVLVDGIKMNSFGGGFDFGHLTTFGLGQVEVVRGPQSAVFGSDAIGGVVSLRSALGGRPAARGLIEAGSYGTTRLAVGTTGTRGAVDWGVSVERASSDGWTGEAPASSDLVTNDDYRASDVALAVNWRAGGRSTLRADARFGTNDRGNPGPFGSNPVGAYSGIDRVSRGANDTGAGSVVFTHQWNPQTALRVQTTYADLRSHFTSAFGDSDSRSRRLNAQAQVDRSFTGVFSATAGAAFEAERAGSTFITGAQAQQIPIDRSIGSVFGEARWRSASRLFVTAGLRASAVTRDAVEADPYAWTPRPALAEDRLYSVNPRAAVSYYLRTSDQARGDWSRIHASAGTGIRPPDAFEIAYSDNPSLKPERSQSADGGFEQALAGGLIVADVTAFFNHYDDLIIAVGRSLQDYSRYRTDNISNARARGLETSAAIRTRQGLEARVTYTFLDTGVLAVDGSASAAPPPFATGDWLVRRPRHQASVDLVWNTRRATIMARAGGRSRVLDVEPNWGASGGLFHAPGFAVADLGGAWHLTPQVDLTARIDNLFDREYETVLGYPAPRRSFTVGVRLAAGR